MDAARHDTDLAGAWCNDARTVGTDETRIRGSQGRLDPEHIQHRNALGNAGDDPDARICGFQYGIRRERRWHVDHAGIRTGLAHCFMHRVEYGTLQMLLPPFSRSYTTHQLGAIGDGLLGMKGSLFAGETLADHFGITVY